MRQSSVVLIALISCAVIASVVALEPLTDAQALRLFSAWQRQYNKHNEYYAHDVESFQYRLEIFRRNVEFIREFNEQHAESSGKLKLKATRFADLTREEFAELYLSRKPMHEANSETLPLAQLLSSKAVNALPTSVDWRTKGVVTGIKDQGQCGSCWAFSAVAAIESAWALKNNTLVSLSEQNLVDCSHNGGNSGCNGGDMVPAYEYVIKNKGIDTEASYPYKAQDGSCKFSTSHIGAHITSYVQVTSGSETALAEAVANVGPVAVGIDANHDEFMFYSSGILYVRGCSTTELDHGVAAVGYGQDASGNHYWIVKNSWGTDWGMKGYVWMAKDRSNNCGIATDASYPIV